MKNKLIIFTFLLLLVCGVHSQKTKILDSTSIEFKAKVMCINRQGISDIKTMLDQIDVKKTSFLNTKYKDFVFLKVEFTDNIFYENVYSQQQSVGTGLFGSCTYYIGFNKINSKFYRLGGFDIVDIDDFFKDLEHQEVIVFKDLEGGNEVEDIDIYCLYDYYKSKPKKRLKKGFYCFPKCSKEIVKKIGKPHTSKKDNVPN